MQNNVFIKNMAKLSQNISAVPPPHPKQQSTTVYFKFEQVTPQNIGDWVIMKIMMMMVVVVVMIVMKTMLLVLKIDDQRSI